MDTDLEMQVWWRAGITDVADVLPSLDALPGPQIYARWIQMAIEGKDSSSIPKSVLDDDDAFVRSPSVRLCVGHPAMCDAIDRLPEGWRTDPPVLSGVVSVVA
jgi:hypothetical protein